MTPFDPRLPIIAAQAKVRTTHVFHCWHAMRDMGSAFHKQAFANFAGLELRHVERIIAALMDHDALPSKKRVQARRGERLADDFVMPSDWIDWAVEQRRWEPADAKDEAASFIDFWQAKSGKDACKLDWRKTWQNWVRNSRRPNGTYSANKPDAQVWVEFCEGQLQKAKQDNNQARIREWQSKLDDARAKSFDNVVELRREG